MKVPVLGKASGFVLTATGTVLGCQILRPIERIPYIGKYAPYVELGLGASAAFASIKILKFKIISQGVATGLFISGALKTIARVMG